MIQYCNKLLIAIKLINNRSNVKKNTLVTIISLLIVSTNHAQIINAGFENWTNGKPEGWEINSSSMVNRTNNSYSGSFAVKLSGENKIGSVSTAQLINGTSENFGTPVSQRHSSFNGWFKYIHTYYEKLELSVLMKKNGYIIGEGTIDSLPEATDYKQFTCFITYYSNEIPDTLVIVLKFTDYNISGVPTGAAAYFDDLSLEGLVDVKEIINNQSPPVYILKQNYPNPFNPTTKISWQSPVGSWQTLKVYDVLGNEVATLVDEYKPAGSYVVEFDGSKLSSGVYFYKIQVGEYVSVKKMILLR